MKRPTLALLLGAAVIGGLCLARRRPLDLRVQVVIITGASAGIGRAAAHAFAAQGARVALVARRANLLEALAAELDGEVLILPADISSDTDLEAVVERVLATWGQIDILVNNAGYARGGWLAEIAPDDIQRMLNVNVYGLIRLTQKVVPHMQRQRRGTIVNVSSVAGEVRSPGQSVYGSTKAAVNAFSEIMRRELAGTGVHVALVAPGWTRTDMIGKEDSLETLRRAGVYNRWYTLDTPETVAAAIVDAVRRRRREIIMGGAAFQLGWRMGRLSPRLMDLHYALWLNPERLAQAMRHTLR